MVSNSGNALWLKSFAKAVLPKPVVRQISSVRARRRSIAEHSRLCLMREEMRPELMCEARIVPNRSMLLDLLPKHGVVAEIGVADGEFSAEILQRTKPQKLHLIDPWDSPIEIYSEAALDEINIKFQEQINNSTVIVNRGYSHNVIGSFRDEYFDWVYIDAAHDYDNVKQDLECIWRKMKKGGYICGHDYVNWASSEDRYGVTEAVNEFANKTGSKLLFLTNQSDKHDSFALKVL
jgi:predicted O-methyltransferase YrrM